MKKWLFAAVLFTLAAALLSSCASSRKTGCPGVERIIH